MITFLTGTYTTGTASDGIYQIKLDTEKNCFADCVPFIKAKDPSYLAKYKDVFFAVNENLTPHEPGKLIRYRCQKDGTYVKDGCVSTLGENPCHVQVSPDGNTAAVCNYTSGSAAVYRTEDLSLCCFHQGTGSSVHPRQKNAHAHQAVWYEDSWLICDLGGDSIWRLWEDGRCDEHFLCVPGGTGPRHLVTYKDRAYIGTELSNELLTLSLSDGALLDRQSALKNADAQSAAAAVRLFSGNIYISNRGENTVSVFSLENPDRPDKTGTYPVNGQNPRDIQVLPEGILCACTEGVAWLKRETDGSCIFSDFVPVPCAVSILMNDF